MSLPQLLYFALVLRSCGPQTVLNGLVHIVVVAASNHNACDIVVSLSFEGLIGSLEMGEDLKDRLPILIVFGLKVGPSGISSLPIVLLRISSHNVEIYKPNIQLFS